MNCAINYEVYEDRAGALYLCILDNKWKILRIFNGFEYGERGILVEAIKALENDPSAYESWEGDLVDSYDGDVSVDGLYRAISWDDAHMCLIANNAGILVSAMGAAALRAFGINE